MSLFARNLCPAVGGSIGMSAIDCWDEATEHWLTPCTAFSEPGTGLEDADDSRSTAVGYDMCK